MTHIVVPRRRVAITPREAPLGEPYDLSCHQFCEACIAAIIDLSSSPESTIASKSQPALYKKVIGSIGDIRKRQSCQICKLVAQAVQQLCPPYARENIQNEEEIIQLSVRSNEETVTISSSRFFIAEIVDVRALLSEGQGVLSESDKRQESSRLPCCSCCSNPPRLCHISSQINLDTVRNWLQECNANHRCGEQQDGHHEINEDSYPSILIDVKGKNLVIQKQTIQRYCSLSYVYGNANPFHTTRQNLSALLEPGALNDPEFLPPATIRDAMTIVEGIGEKYLWVDSLCIVHDQDDLFHNAIESMGAYYRNSVVTIAVASNLAASEHIPGIRPETRHPLPWIEVYGTQIYACPVPLHLELEGSKYESRGWTYQERLLSTRTLYITKTLAYFHCLEYGRSELNNDGNIFNKLNPLHEKKAISVAPEGGVDNFQESSEWVNYFELVRNYSQKGLTYPSDELVAFEGILGRLGSMYNTEFFAGLPISAFLIALHWIPGYEMDRNHEPLSKRREGFPTWSWAAQDGPVEWLEAVIYQGWWEWEGIGVPGQMMNRPAARLDCTAQISFRSQGISVEGLSAELTTTIVFPEHVLSPGAGCPIPLIKVLDSQGRWCGRICHTSPNILSSPGVAEVGLIVLSTCAARKSLLRTDSGNGIWEWDYLFDTSAFPTTKEDGKLARLCNLLLVEYKGDGKAERRALCQIHADVWEHMEWKEQDVILI